jgi:hypothetical protein
VARGYGNAGARRAAGAGTCGAAAAACAAKRACACGLRSVGAGFLGCGGVVVEGLAEDFAVNLLKTGDIVWGWICASFCRA